MANDRRNIARPNGSDNRENYFKDVANGEIRQFSIIHLGYDPDDDDPPLRDLFKELRQQLDRNAKRQKALSAVAAVIITALLSGAAWPIAQHFLPGFSGH